MKIDPSHQPLIEVRSVSRDVQLHDHSKQIIENASFSIAEGSFTIIHGPSGSGKTTLLNIITGLDKPTVGSVGYRGKDIYNLSKSELAHFRARTMGIVYQSNFWVRSLKVIENVALPLYFLGYTKEDAEREALESLKSVGMQKHRDTLPSLLSGGEQQKVALARALVSDPSYIVADEPTGNLDSKSGDDIIELLHYFHSELKRTVVLVTHNESYLKHGTQILNVRDGVVTETKQTPLYADIIKHTPRVRSLSALNTKKTRPIRFSLLLHMAIENLKYKKLRSGLTMLGMIIGVGSVFGLLTFGLGLQNLVQEQIIGTESVKVIDVTSVNSEILMLDEKSVQRLYDIGNVVKLGKQSTSAGDLVLGAARSDTIVYGVDTSYLELSNLTIVSGRKINPINSREAMVSRSLLNSLGYKDVSKAVGQEMTLGLKLEDADYDIEQPFKVVGVVDTGSGTVVYIPQSVYGEAKVKKYDQVKIVSSDKTTIADVRRQVETLGFQTSSPLDTIAQVNRFFQFFNFALIGVGSVGMFIAIIGIFNTLTIALLERVREIGLMIALGARSRDVRLLFISEALLIALIGGVIGMALATLLGYAVDILMNYLSGQRGVGESFSLFVTPLWLIVTSVLATALIGYLVAYAPAKRASKINPIDALRRE